MPLNLICLTFSPSNSCNKIKKKAVIPAPCNQTLAPFLCAFKECAEGEPHTQTPYEHCCSVWGCRFSLKGNVPSPTGYNPQLSLFWSVTFRSLWNIQRALALPKQAKLFPHLNKAQVGKKLSWTGQVGIPNVCVPIPLGIPAIAWHASKQDDLQMSEGWSCHASCLKRLCKD